MKPLNAFAEAIRDTGLPCPESIHPDGKIHRFPTNGQSSDKAGWYVLFDNGNDLFAGAFGCWRNNVEITWKSSSREWTEREQQQVEQARAKAREERERAHEEAKQQAEQEYSRLKPIREHSYLSKKNVQAHGSMPLKGDSQGNLIIPLHDLDAQIHTFQKISPDGKKLFMPGGRVAGNFFVIDGNEQYIIAEGYATAASIHEATGATVVVAFNAGNLKPVSEEFKGLFPEKIFIIAADNDRWTSLPDGRVNPGLIKATEAAEAVEGRVVCPEFADKHLKQHPKDFNDLARLEGLEAVQEQFGEALDQNSGNVWDSPVDLTSLIDVAPPRIEWFAQDRITLGRGFVLTGVGGSSKTRMLYHLAAGAAIGRLTWQWHIETTGRSILVLTEDVAADLHRTIHSLCLSLEISLEEKQKIYNSIIPYPLAGQDIKLLAKNKAGTLTKSHLFHALSQKIKDLGDIAFVGLDPALSLTDGDELDQGNQRTLGKMADDLAVQTGAACALVTHATKGSLTKDELTSHNSRGGGAITDAVRAEFVMRTMTSKEATQAKLQDKEERFRHVQLVGTKGNYLPPDAYIPVWLRRDQYGMLHEADITFSENEPSKKDMGALEILKDMSRTSTPPLKEWKNACLEAGIIKANSEDAQKKEMDRIKNKLKESGYIKKGHGRGIWIPINEIDFTDFN